MDKFRFLNWKVYNDAKLLFNIILGFVNKLPKEYRFEIGNQIINDISNQIGGFKKIL